MDACGPRCPQRKGPDGTILRTSALRTLEWTTAGGERSARAPPQEPVGLTVAHATAALWEAVLGAGRAAVHVHCKRPATTECAQSAPVPSGCGQTARLRCCSACE